MVAAIGRIVKEGGEIEVELNWREGFQQPSKIASAARLGQPSTSPIIVPVPVSGKELFQAPANPQNENGPNRVRNSRRRKSDVSRFRIHPQLLHLAIQIRSMQPQAFSGLR